MGESMKSKILSIMLGGILTFGGAVTAVADIPDMSVVIGKKSFSLEYANKRENLKEISDAMRNANGEIYIKVRNKWHDNYGNIVDDSSIQEVEHTSSQGTVRYAEHDGEIITNKEVPLVNIVKEQNALEKYIKEGKHSVKVYTVGLSGENLKKYNDIDSRFKKAMSEDIEWFKEYSEKHKGNPPWNEKFGVTEEELNFVANIKDKVEMLELEDTYVNIVKQEDGTLFFENNIKLNALNKIIVNTQENNVDLNMGLSDDGEIAEYEIDIKASEKQKYIKWNGALYLKRFNRVVDVSEADSNKIYGYMQVCVGSTEEEGKTIMGYIETVIYNGVKSNGIIFLIFD